jgi:hypothetical protein
MTLMTNLKRQDKQLNILTEFKYSEEANEKAKQDLEDYRINFPDESTILADGFELAFLGCGYSFGGSHAIYSLFDCLQILMQRDGMTFDEAEEYFEYNVIGSYVGDRMPVFLITMKEVTVEHINQECQN